LRYGPWNGDIVDRLKTAADALGVTATAARWRLVNLGQLTDAAARQIPDAALRGIGRPLPLFSTMRDADAAQRRDGSEVDDEGPPPLFSKSFIEVIALAIKQGQLAARRAARPISPTCRWTSWWRCAPFTGWKSRSTCEQPMVRHRGPVLVDTNVILECWRIRAWRALAGGYGVETMEECVIETQTGFQRRRPEQQIDRAALVGWLKAVHKVGDKERAAAIVREPLFSYLDPGEHALRAHALTRADAWVLCGPDRASLRIGIRLGFRDRLMALEDLLEDAGHRPATPLRTAYTSNWHAKALGELGMMEGAKRS
jgi:hypothetical protein